MNGFPAGVTTIASCKHCHWEKLDSPGGWWWRCDADHPEVRAQLEEGRARQQRSQDQEEEQFWYRKEATKK